MELIEKKYDKYYTKVDIVTELIKHIDFSKFSIAIEPSAGCGNFSNNIPIKCISFDIKPEDDEKEIIEADFLEININEYLDNDDKVIVIGNPPFGRQASLAVKFFNKSALIKNTICIAMILPKSFKKSSIKNRLNLDFTLSQELELKKYSFTYGGKDYDVPCIFQIWMRTSIKRKKDPKFKLCDKFQFVIEKDCNVDTIAFRRVGVYAGKASLYSKQSKQSHYFLTCSDEIIIIKDLLHNLNSIKWEHNNTTGPRSISKNELIEKLNMM